MAPLGQQYAAAPPLDWESARAHPAARFPDPMVRPTNATLFARMEERRDARSSSDTSFNCAAIIEPIVVIIDRDAAMRRSLAAKIAEAGCYPIGFESAEDFFRAPSIDAPTCMVLEVALPDLAAFEIFDRVRRERADIPVIFTSHGKDVSIAVQAMKEGAVEFLPKPYDDQAMLRAIEYAIDVSRAVRDCAVRTEALREAYASLSRRERDVMALVVSGLLNKQIAYELSICEKTVKAHRGQVMRKMRVRSVAKLVKLSLVLQARPPQIAPFNPRCAEAGALQDLANPDAGVRLDRPPLERAMVQNH